MMMALLRVRKMMGLITPLVILYMTTIYKLRRSSLKKRRVSINKTNIYNISPQFLVI